MKYRAHIPVQSYGFIEVESDDIDEIKRVYNEYTETPVAFKGSGDFVKLESFTKETILWDELNHKYQDLDGNELIGGSTYAETFAKPFDRDQILAACEKAWGVETAIIADIWKMNAKASTSYGDSLHVALELAHKHWKVGDKIKDKKKGLETNYSLPKQPHVRKAVESFAEEFGLDALPEVLVTDAKNKRAGSIDRLQVIDKKKKICRVGDFKTSVMDKDKEKIYQHQLSYYAAILKAHGWTVTGLDLYMYDDGWTHKELKVLEVK